MYETYIKEIEETKNHLSVRGFLEDFGISKKEVNHTITRRWLHEIGYENKERKKIYFTDKHGNKDNVSYREESLQNILRKSSIPNTYRWVHLREDVTKKWRKRMD